ncbi:hypothetical protein LPLAFNJD_LOCUS2883 [Methylorubrum aminovorans]
MAKRLELETLRADLAAVEGLLARRSRERDPVGHFQFQQRKELLEQQLRELDTVDEPLAAVGLFFAGRPVLGSRGIKADFGTQAISSFQSVVSSRFAAESGPVGQRGRTRHRDRSQLIIKDVVRGSFGFVLEEAAGDTDGSPCLKPALDDVVSIIYSSAKGDQADFNEITDVQDAQVLNSVKSFFELLDNQGASVRLVEGNRDFTISRDEVSRARARTANLEVNESNEDFIGILFLLPEGRRFELHDQRDGTVRKGFISRDCYDTLITPEGRVRVGLAGSRQLATLKVRRTDLRNGETRYSYTLLATRDAGPGAAHEMTGPE